jgi:hypothetical protein
MLETYKATLRGNQIVWNDEKPEIGDEKSEIEIFVTILESPSEKKPRPFGLCKGEFVVPDDFDAPLPEEVMASFEQ